jgi:hypothetical protein
MRSQGTAFDLHHDSPTTSAVQHLSVSGVKSAFPVASFIDETDVHVPLTLYTTYPHTFCSWLSSGEGHLEFAKPAYTDEVKLALLAHCLLPHQHPLNMSIWTTSRPTENINYYSQQSKGEAANSLTTPSTLSAIFPLHSHRTLLYYTSPSTHWNPIITTNSSLAGLIQHELRLHFSRFSNRSGPSRP